MSLPTEGRIRSANRPQHKRKTADTHAIKGLKSLVKKKPPLPLSCT